MAARGNQRGKAIKVIPMPAGNKASQQRSPGYIDSFPQKWELLQDRLAVRGPWTDVDAGNKHAIGTMAEERRGPQGKPTTGDAGFSALSRPASSRLTALFVYFIANVIIFFPVDLFLEVTAPFTRVHIELW